MVIAKILSLLVAIMLVLPEPTSAQGELLIAFEGDDDIQLYGGSITTHLEDVLSGSRSLIGDTLTQNATWFTLIRTRQGVLVPGFEYSISLRYKVLHGEKGAFLYFLCRSADQGVGKYDRGWQQSQDVAHEIGNVKTLTQTVGIANLLDYQLVLGIKGHARIIIDDISIIRGAAYAESPPDEANASRIPPTATPLAHISFDELSGPLAIQRPVGQIATDALQKNVLLADSTQSSSTWNIYASTEAGLFRPHNRYFFKIKYYVHDLTPESKFYALLRSTSGKQYDLFLKFWRRAPNTPGVFYTDSRIYFSKVDYQLHLGIQGKGKIEIHSIEILEEPGYENVQLKNRPVFDKSKANLVWQEEFAGEHIDTTKWEIAGDHARRGGMWRKTNAFLDGLGHLVLQFDKSDGTYDSGCIKSLEGFTFGYFEARIKLNTNPGHWIAFWLMSASVNRVGDSGIDGTEIDIVESPWRGAGKVSHALHWDGYGEDHQSISWHPEIPNLDEGWHTFAVDWFEHGYVFYVDGMETWRTYSGEVAQVPLRIFISDELGGWSGKPDDQNLPDAAYVDYVRVYQSRPSSGTPPPTLPGEVRVFPAESSRQRPIQ